MSELRVALLGAFSFPAPQGSQVFAADQARALARAGARVSLFCYGRGVGATPEGVEILRIPAALSPRSYRSGLHPAKPFADAALLRRLAGAARARRIDAVLAHNAEAASVALRARAAPTLYVAHTLFEEELGSHLPAALEAPFAPALARLGARIDRGVARRVDASIALTAHAAERLGRIATGPVALIPPGVERQPPPQAGEVRAACARHGLEPGGFAIYAGNLDRYQDLETLRAAAARLASRSFVVATHARPRSDLAPLRILRVDAGEARSLTHAAALAVAPRRRRGGFPIKLLNYMEASRAIVAREAQAHTLRSGCNALLVGREAGVEAFARAIESLFRDPARADALGRAARATLEREHDWQRLAQRTLALVERVASDPAAGLRREGAP